MTTAAGPLWGPLRTAAAALCPPLAIEEEDRSRLRVVLREPASGDPVVVRYRSQRGLFLRTYFLVFEADVAGTGPAGAGEMVLRRRGLGWRRPAPGGGRAWRDAFGRDVRAHAKRARAERLTLGWDPEPGRWRVRVETLSGGATATFFPPLLTPNPLLPDEAKALVGLIETIRRATA